MRRLHADLLLICAAVIWGVAFIFQKTAMDHVGPLTFIASRGAVAVLALLPLALYEARQSETTADRRVWHIALAGGVMFFIGAWLQQEGIRTATVTNTGFLTALYVVITPFVAWLAMGRVPSWLVWPAVALSAVGTWLLGGGIRSSCGRSCVDTTSTSPPRQTPYVCSAVSSTATPPSS